jgi:DNA-binding response OmpR family regulator
MANLLIVDDDAGIREMLHMHLALAGHHCLLAEDGSQARAALMAARIDVALLDVMLPGEDGFSLGAAFVDKGVPLLFLTAKTAVADRVRGLTLGAEDYILKPFEPAELLARVDVILRRSCKGEQAYHDRLVTVDYVARLVHCNGEPLPLTALEYDLLALLTRRTGEAISREELLTSVWGYDYIGETRTVDVHVQRLRKKLGDESAKVIETVYKYGYRYALREGEQP